MNVKKLWAMTHTLEFINRTLTEYNKFFMGGLGKFRV